MRREPADVPVHPLRAVVADPREGFAYMVRTPWLLATLLYASLMLLVFLGPFEVLALCTILYLASIPIGVARYRQLDRAHSGDGAPPPPAPEL